MSFFLNNDSLYDLATGEITGSITYSGPPGSASGITPTTGQIVGKFDPNYYYVTNINDAPLLPSAAPRTPLGITQDKTAISANGTDTVTFSGVPSGTACTIDSATPVIITDGTLEFTATTAGTYTLLFTNFPQTPATFEVVAT